MILEEIKDIKSGISDLRKFGIIIGIVLGILGGLSLWRGREYYPYILSISAIFLLLGISFPLLLKPIHKIWMTFAIIMGWFMTRVILSILFFVVITPIALFARLIGKDFLSLRFRRDSADTYWIPKEKVKFEKSDYERQF
ncbi:MAG: SxtJ family membrane protein [Nitrospirota bacterium]